MQPRLIWVLAYLGRGRINPTTWHFQPWIYSPQGRRSAYLPSTRRPLLPRLAIGDGLGEAARAAGGVQGGVGWQHRRAAELGQEDEQEVRRRRGGARLVEQGAGHMDGQPQWVFGKPFKKPARDRKSQENTNADLPHTHPAVSRPCLPAPPGRQEAPRPATRAPINVGQ